VRPVVGIDPSLAGTTIATRDGITKIVPKIDGIPRLVLIRNRTIETIALTHPRGSCFADPLVVIEGYAFARPNQAHQIGELGGALRLALWAAGLEWVEIAPSQLKLWATGKGNAPKDAVVSAVSARLGRTFESNDHVDAYVLRDIGTAYLHGASELGGITAPRRKVLDSITTIRRPAT
jgi:crossover junction endodeoxyribonuclease RuvC